MSSEKEIIQKIQESDDLSAYRNADLRCYLKYIGVPIFGKKAELIECILGAKSLNLDQNKAKQNEDKAIDEKRVHHRLTTPLGEKLPNPYSLSVNWETECDNFPLFTINELYNYLVLSKHRTFDFDSLKAKKELRAKVFYEDGHIQNVKFHPVSNISSHCFIKSDCLPSIPTKDAKKKPAYKIWICVSKHTGQVHSAFYACVSGTSECCSNHVSALLFALIDLSEKRRTGKLSPTSTACSWIKPRKRHLSPRKSQAIFDKKLKETAVSKLPASVPGTSHTKITYISSSLRKAKFRQRLLKVNPRAAWLKKFTELPESSDVVQAHSVNLNIPQLHNIQFFYADNIDLLSDSCSEYFNSYVESLCINDEECAGIEKSACDQSVNNLWRIVRKGRLTSSIFERIVKMKETTAPDNLLKQLLGYEPHHSGKAVEHGLQYESVARDSYMLVAREQHPPLCVKECGFIINPKLPFLGTSLDGLVTCAHCEDPKGLLEIKCPYTWKDNTPEEACLSSSFHCVLEGGQPRLKRNHSYYYQVQGQLALTNRKWCDFVVWTFKGMSIERICYDEQFCFGMLNKLRSFYIKVMLPEMFSERVKREIPLHKELHVNVPVNDVNSD